MKKYIYNFVIKGTVLASLVVIVPTDMQAVTIVNSVHSESSTGGQTVTSGQSGQDGTPGSDGKNGVDGADGAPGVSGRNVVMDDIRAAVSVTSVVDGETVLYDSQNNKSGIPERDMHVVITSVSSSTQPQYQIAMKSDAAISDNVVTLTPDQSSQIYEILTSLHNLFVSYVSSLLNRSI